MMTQKLAKAMALLCLAQTLFVTNYVEAGCLDGICKMLGLGNNNAANYNKQEVNQCMFNLRGQIGQMVPPEPVKVFSEQILQTIQQQYGQQDSNKISLYASIRWNWDQFVQWMQVIGRPYECDAFGDQVISQLNGNECFIIQPNAPVDKNFAYLLSNALLQDVITDRIIGAGLACSWSKQLIQADGEPSPSYYDSASPAEQGDSSLGMSILGGVVAGMVLDDVISDVAGMAFEADDSSYDDFDSFSDE